MAKEFKVGDKCYLPVEITDTNFGRDFPVQFRYFDGEDHYTESVAYKEGVLLTAEDVVSKYKTKADAMEVVSDSLQKENEELKTKVERLTTWYEEANRTASEATEANDELKAKIAELRTRNAELEALLKEVTATRDEAIKQNEDLESELEDARHVNEYAVETARSKEKLVGEQRELVKKYSVVIDILIDKITALKKGENDG